MTKGYYGIKNLDLRICGIYGFGGVTKTVTAEGVVEKLNALE
jgi:hypothetical protein